MITAVRWLARICEVGIVLGALAALGLWCSIPDPGPLATRNPATTAFIELRKAEGQTIDWRWRPLGSISRFLRAAVVYAEDDRFYEHDGVDWRAMKQALDERVDTGAFGRGGSTITQQLAKNLYLSPDRSLIRKARELLITYRLEDELSKQRILELYLNICEWGPGVFGAEAAARHWFGHSAQRLTPAEAVRLATALPNPSVRTPVKSSSMLRKKRVRLLRRLRSQGLIGADEERAALVDLGAADAYVRPEKPELSEPE
jgi:monofunctional glycosyltransferase